MNTQFMSALPLRAPETLSSLSKAQLRSQNPIGKLSSFSKLTLELTYEVSTTIVIGRPDNKQNRYRSGEECECEELRLRRGLPLYHVGYMCFVSSSFHK